MIKKLLTTQEAAAVIGVSRGYLYILMHRREIPFYKPNGKKAYFDEKDIEAYLTRCRVSSAEELEARAQAVLNHH